MEVETNPNEIELNVSIDDDKLDENQNLTSKAQEADYQQRKLDGKLKKYEMILKNAEKINRVDESEVLR